MAIDSNIAKMNIRSAGTKRMEIDQTVQNTPATIPSNIRMLVGFSKQGPVNRPILIRNTKEFMDTFGTIDRTLENRGCYFHRSALAMLEVAPIYCLNLLKPQYGDMVDVIDFSLSPTNRIMDEGEEHTAQSMLPYSYKGMYNIDTVWTPDEECMLYNVGRDINWRHGDADDDPKKGHQTNNLLSFTNIGKKPVSVLVTKSAKENVKNYDITAVEWYGKGNVPEYIHEDSYISDFFVDVYVFDGKWGAEENGENKPYVRFASDIKFAKYFDSYKGLKRKLKDTDTIDTSLYAFLNESDVTLLGKYTGCLLPGFVDKRGRDVYIERMVNNDTDVNGVMCAVNEAVFGNIPYGEYADGVKTGYDMVGHTLAYEPDADTNASIEFLAYKDDVVINDHCSYVSVVTGQEVIDAIMPKDNEFILEDTSTMAGEINVGDYVVSNNTDGSRRLARVVTIQGRVVDEGATNEGRYKLVTCSTKVYFNSEGSDESVIKVEPLTNWFTHYQIFNLNGFTLTALHQPDGTNKRQNEILSVLEEDSDDSNLFKALTDRTFIRFRYLVDSFGYGIEESCKSVYTKLCNKRKSALAIINVPSCADFKNCPDPIFTDTNGSVSAELISQGGDMTKNPSFLFSLPTELEGATYGAYYYPYMRVYSNYSVLNVPPAAYVSNNYITKYGKGRAWESVAGEKRGVLKGNGIIGTEASLVEDHRNYLEPMGINSIIYRDGIGCEIYANRTAKQKPESALSSISVREVCIYIEDEIEKILESYLFDNNTAQTRLEIKTLVDNFLQGVADCGGIIAFKTVMDTSNNTPEIIAKKMGVIDVYIEPSEPMDILIQRVTIVKSGQIESSGF